MALQGGVQCVTFCAGCLNLEDVILDFFFTSKAFDLHVLLMCSQTVCVCMCKSTVQSSYLSFNGAVQ